MAQTIVSEESTIELTAEAQIEATPERVYRAWTNSKEMESWWGEEGMYRFTHCDFDLRVGGKWHSEGVGSDGATFSIRGKYLVLDEPNAVSFTWKPNWDEGTPETKIELEFKEWKGGTKLKLRHSGFLSEASRSKHKKGWVRVVGWLRGYAEVPEPPVKNSARSASYR